MRTVEHPWDWWAYHFRVVHRSQIPGIGQWDDELIEMIVEVLALRPGDRVLDLACGSGDHARRLARRGMEVVGLEIAPSLVAHCRQEAAAEGLETVRFEQGDMRALDEENAFDAVLLLSGSFGFFDDTTNLDVLRRMARALRPGGRLLVDVFDPARMMIRPIRRTWSYYGGGYNLRTTWWQPESCTYASEFLFIDDEGVLHTAAEPERIRVYSLPEWRAMFDQVDLELTRALADHKLPPVDYDRDHYDDLVLVATARA
ncbi:MAG: class I SAM-dependent methyltransferase [Anaerolineae bacterium]